jgi:hypothetical protein
MADGPPKAQKELLLPHKRASNFSYVVADGYMVRVEGANVVLTFYVNDTLVTGERLELAVETPGAATYRSASVEEANQRLQIIAVRMPINDFLAGTDVLRQKVEELMKLQGQPPGASTQ